MCAPLWKDIEKHLAAPKASWNGSHIIEGQEESSSIEDRFSLVFEM